MEKNSDFKKSFSVFILLTSKSVALSLMTVFIYVFAFMPQLSFSTGAALPGAPLLYAAGDKIAAPEVKNNLRREVTGVVESVSAPVNPRETSMVVDCGDSSSIELILSPSTNYYPGDYYPCAGDRVKVNYIVLGIFKKYVMAYSVSLIEEFSGINKDNFKIIKKD